jgi:hypothetical protein
VPHQPRVHVPQLSGLCLFLSAEALRSLFKPPAPLLTRATVLCSTSSTLSFHQLAPTDRFNPLVQRSEEWSDTSSVTDKDARVTVRMTTTIIKVTYHVTKILLPSGFYSTNMSVFDGHCYITTKPILSWRFLPPGSIAICLSVI